MKLLANPFKNSHPVLRRAAMSSLAGLLAIGSVSFVSAGLDTGIKSSNSPVLDTPGSPAVLELKDREENKTYTSPPFEARHDFNAIAPHWQEKLGEHDHRHIDIRVSSDGQEWTDWMEIDIEKPLRDDSPNPDRAGPEAPLFIEGRYFQYRIELERDEHTGESPHIADLKINYIDSRETRTQSLMNGLKSFGAKVFAGGAEPRVISRAGWNSPDPDGTRFQGTNKYWPPEYVDTKQTFLHHTATANNHSNPAAVVRGIWDYHANTLGWGDIGYNYILDRHGNIYQGRFGGDHVVAGHVGGYNKGSMGVAVLGCFQPNSPTCNQLNNGNTTGPTNATINGLIDFLAWKHAAFGIHPRTSHSFCDSNGNNCKNIPTIAAHRDARGHGTTECNGKLFYDMSPQIRNRVFNRCNFGSSTNPRPNGVLIRNPGNGRIFLLEDGAKRWITSPAAANSYRLRLGHAYNVTRAELQSIPSGTPMKIAEGSLIRAVDDNKIYIVDKDGDTYKKRHITSPAVMNKFDLGGVSAYRISQGQVNSYPAAPAVLAGSTAPNGLIMTSRDTPRIFVVRNDKKRHITSPAVFNSHRYGGHVRVVAHGTLQETPTGTAFDRMRTGTLVSNPNTSMIFAIDSDGNNKERRWITSPPALTRAGFRWDQIRNIPMRELNSYSDASSIVCYVL